MRIVRPEIRCAKARSCILKTTVFIAAAAVMVGGAAAGEVAWPGKSATEFSMFAALQRFRIYTAYCSANVPRLQARFAGMMDDLATRMQRVSTGLLASGAFSDLKDSPVPPEIVFAFQDMYEDMEHNFERRDPETSCPLALESLRTQDDDSLKSELESALVAVRNMMRNVEKASAP